MASVSVEIPQGILGISRDDILKFPFPYKLWIVTNLPTSNIVHWNFDGTIILVNLQRLQEYLHSPQSIFVIKTTCKFLKHLEDFQFSRLDDTSPGTVVELSYQHTNFQRHRLDLVGNIRRVTFFNLDNAQNIELQASDEAKGASATTNSTNGCAARMRGDLCFMEHGLLTEMQKKRIYSETVFAFARESKVLQEKLKKGDSKVNMGCASNKRGRSACLEREQIVVLPKHVYENPYDSILAGKGGLQGFKYGGYYGNCTAEQIDNFFGDYLPKYSEGGVLKVKNFKNNEEQNGQDVKSPETTEKTESSYLVDETSTSVPSSESLVPIDVDNFVIKSSKEVSKLLAAPKINISASFNCTSGALEYSITEQYSENSILVPPLDALNNMPTELSESQPIAAFEKRQDTPEIITNSPIHRRHVITREQEENNDFYDDLRATFELLQNQPY